MSDLEYIVEDDDKLVAKYAERNADSDKLLGVVESYESTWPMDGQDNDYDVGGSIEGYPLHFGINDEHVTIEIDLSDSDYDAQEILGMGDKLDALFNETDTWYHDVLRDVDPRIRKAFKQNDLDETEYDDRFTGGRL